MGIPVSNMDKVEAWKGGAILQPGKHKVTITSAEEGTSSGNYPQVELEFDSDAGAGNIRDWLVFSGEASLGKAKMLLEALSIISEGGDWEFPTTALVGKRLVITVVQEPKYNDPSKTVNKVVAYEPPGTDVPGDTSGLGNGASGSDDVPF